MGYFAEIYRRDLPHRAKTVYMYLKDRSDQKGQCYPTIGTIRKGTASVPQDGGTGDRRQPALYFGG